MGGVIQSDDIKYVSYYEDYFERTFLMNKSDLIKSFAENQNISIEEAGKVVDFIFKTFSDELGNGGRIEIRGFGVFYVKEYAPYKGRNPKTGELISIKGKNLPVFKVGKKLKERVNLGI
jgi:integration host factor subunit beta